jgi:hypothetical protein
MGGLFFEICKKIFSEYKYTTILLVCQLISSFYNENLGYLTGEKQEFIENHKKSAFPRNRPGKLNDW